MPIYVFDGASNFKNQRPITIFDANGSPINVAYAYEFDSYGTPRLVYGGVGPEWLAKYDSETNTAKYNYITGINNAVAGGTEVYGEDLGKTITIYGINFIIGFPDAPDTGQGNDRDQTVIYEFDPSEINLYGATAISFKGNGVTSGSVHGSMKISTEAWFGFGGVETSLFHVGDFTIEGDVWSRSEIVPIDRRIPIDPINANQKIYIKMRHLQQSSFHLSNSKGVLNLLDIIVHYD